MGEITVKTCIVNCYYTLDNVGHVQYEHEQEPSQTYQDLDFPDFLMVNHIIQRLNRKRTQNYTVTTTLLSREPKISSVLSSSLLLY